MIWSFIWLCCQMIKKNKLEIKNITVALKWVFVMCQKWSSDISLWTVGADNTCFLRDKLFSSDFISSIGIFLWNTKKKRFKFGLWAVELDIKNYACHLKFFWLKNFLTIFIEMLIYKVVLVSGVQQSELYIYMYIFFFNSLFHYMLLQDI